MYAQFVHSIASVGLTDRLPDGKKKKLKLKRKRSISVRYGDYAGKSRESLRSGRILFEAECFNSSVSRLYYAMFQMSVAILIKLGISSPKKGEYGHAWVQAAVAQVVIRGRKLLPGRMASFLPDAIKLREEADYGTANISKKVCRRNLDKVVEFIQKMEDILL